MAGQEPFERAASIVATIKLFRKALRSAAPRGPRTGGTLSIACTCCEPFTSSGSTLATGARRTLDLWVLSLPHSFDFVPTARLLEMQGEGSQPNRAARLVVVSNRAPFRIVHQAGRRRVEPTVGGLATTFLHLLEKHGGLWVAW